MSAMLHYHAFSGEKKSSSGKTDGEVDYTKDFHLYALEWEPDELRWYVDGDMIHSTKTAVSHDQVGHRVPVCAGGDQRHATAGGVAEGVPHTPHYLILNTAVGGAWPGNPDTTTEFPQYHDIDYVRVYQRDSFFTPRGE